MSKDDLGDRMKSYEVTETSETFDNSLPLICRVDGRSFSKFTKSLRKPFDLSFSETMVETAKFLLEKSGASLAYHQSDEISLLFPSIPEDSLSSRMFNGKKQKLVSTIAAMASSKFCVLLSNLGGEYSKKLENNVPTFDCRFFNVPSDIEAGNYFVWRQKDASRNAISMIAQSLYSHKELQGVSTASLREMIADKNFDYEDLTFNFMYGSFFTRESVNVNIDGNKVIRTKTIEHNIPNITYKLLEGE